MVSEEDWPYAAGLQQWPPHEPPGLDERAKHNRILYYQRIYHALECKYALAYFSSVQASFEITDQWHDAAHGIIEMPPEDAKIIGTHSVLITGYSDNERVFRFINSWGPEWGAAGFGTLSYDFFDRYVLDSYVYTLGSTAFPSNDHEEIEAIQWNAPDYLTRPIQVIDLCVGATNERLAWAIAMPHEDCIDVEELFVCPRHRRRGFGTRLLTSLEELSNQLGLPLRIFVPYADCGEQNLIAVKKLLAKENYVVVTNPERWSPCIGLKEVDRIVTPPPPALVRSPRALLVAPPIPLIEIPTGSDPRSTGKPTEETDRTSFVLLSPEENAYEHDSHVVCVVVLSSWSGDHFVNLIDQINRIVQLPTERDPVPIVLVLDDMDGTDREHNLLVRRITDSGAIVLSSQSKDRDDLFYRDPLSFAAREVTAMQSHSVGTMATPMPPASPDGYKQFARALTRLPSDMLKDLIEGRRNDDWKFLP